MGEAANPRQQKILDFLSQHSNSHPYPPTVREIGRAVGLSSSSTVQSHLNTLEKKGLIHRDPTKSRTVEVVGSERGSNASVNPALFQIPLIGQVAAGSPILAEQNVEDHISLGPEIARGEDSYALTVHGDSMINAGIHDGDMVVVKPRHDAPANGTIVVARINNEITGEGEVTVKRFFGEGDRVRLQPENPEMEPIYSGDLTLEGVVVAVIRLLS